MTELHRRPDGRLDMTQFPDENVDQLTQQRISRHLHELSSEPTPNPSNKPNMWLWAAAFAAAAIPILAISTTPESTVYEGDEIQTFYGPVPSEDSENSRPPEMVYCDDGTDITLCDSFSLDPFEEDSPIVQDVLASSRSSLHEIDCDVIETGTDGDPTPLLICSLVDSFGIITETAAEWVIIVGTQEPRSFGQRSMVIIERRELPEQATLTVIAETSEESEISTLFDLTDNTLNAIGFAPSPTDS